MSWAVTTQLCLNYLGQFWFHPVAHLLAHACPFSTVMGFTCLQLFKNSFPTLKYSVAMNFPFQKMNSICSIAYGELLTHPELQYPFKLV